MWIQETLSPKNMTTELSVPSMQKSPWEENLFSLLLCFKESLTMLDDDVKIFVVFVVLAEIMSTSSLPLHLSAIRM